MHYDRYFKPGQKVVLRRHAVVEGQAACLDSLTGRLISCDASGFVVRPLDTGVNDEIAPGTVFELLGDIYDFGMRLTAGFDRTLADGALRLLPRGDLEFFFRRQYLRAECMVWLGWQSGGTPKTLRRQWKSWSSQPANIPEKALPKFSLLQISLGAGGLGMLLPAPVRQDGVLLLFLALDDNKPLICALAEVVWVDKVRPDGVQHAGLQFLSLLDSDRQRIELYVRRCLRAQKPEGEG